MSATAPSPKRRPRGAVPTPPPPRPAPSVPVVDETSAGGVVIKVENGLAYVVVIARRNRAGRLEWCLPKGHLEGKETAPEAAEREVEEETGITSEVLRHIATIDYWFSGTNRRVHKMVHHYLLHFLSGDVTVENDPDQEAEKAAWIPLEEVASLLAYPNERRVVATARDLLFGRP